MAKVSKIVERARIKGKLLKPKTQANPYAKALPKKEAKQFEDDLKFGGKILAMIRTYYYGDKIRIKEYGAKVQQIIDDHIKTLGISELLEPREITYANFGAFIKKHNCNLI